MANIFKFGIEEEFFLVDADTKSAARAMPAAFLEAAKQATGGQARAGPAGAALAVADGGRIRTSQSCRGRNGCGPPAWARLRSALEWRALESRARRPGSQVLVRRGRGRSPAGPRAGRPDRARPGRPGSQPARS